MGGRAWGEKEPNQEASPCCGRQRPRLRLGSDGRAPIPAAWQALFNFPAINNRVIILATAITQQ